MLGFTLNIKLIMVKQTSELHAGERAHVLHILVVALHRPVHRLDINRVGVVTVDEYAVPVEHFRVDRIVSF
jgi:hypothetical protein